MKTMWTALISAIVALLAMLGFAAPASASAAAPSDRSSDAPQPAAPAAERADTPAGTASVEAPTATRWRADVPTRSVPPTMKQRIGAEAHGGSPSARKVPALDALDGLAGLGRILPDDASVKATSQGESDAAAKAYVAAA
ncbi:hypothetical protein GCM10010329_19910 [Streptomyces spiroverticillatus]|uniref:Uncharacterized protein n=1 Tax=Streptomyces finlayi TaxID=67296 RepID=A0A919C8V6_9ACTN|nr:DUF6344 domain-containing protein [Streptomyces finlayi]GGZ98438.1 hypothetical protein GCM10010329_19910 [Streptomyces spiroverticillatus]GHC83332.1 hypothetical protein GCM10010334_12350 [Streptomyces finlayi]